MNREEIMDCIPHRNDMLILDEVTYLDDNSAKGKYYVKGTEFFLNGHYPMKKIVPGTILCEIMAQLLAVYCSRLSCGMPVLADLNNAVFKKMVLPGNTLDISIEVIKGSRRVVQAHGEIKIGEELCSKADFTVACLIDKKF